MIGAGVGTCEVTSDGGLVVGEFVENGGAVACTGGRVPETGAALDPVGLLLATGAVGWIDGADVVGGHVRLNAY